MTTASNSAILDPVNAAQMLTMHEVDFNILTVLTGYAAENIDRIYSFFKRKGFKYLQFIPCLRPFGDKSESELYMTNEQYAYFTINIYLPGGRRVRGFVGIEPLVHPCP